jgi:hypothetical protein
MREQKIRNGVKGALNVQKLIRQNHMGNMDELFRGIMAFHEAGLIVE